MPENLFAKPVAKAMAMRFVRKLIRKID